MSKISLKLINAYANAYDLSYKKLYSEPKIYDANKNLAVRWYVYYSFRNPTTQLLERQDPIYAGVNEYKILKERITAIKILRDAVSAILKGGFNPFSSENEDNTQEVKLTVVDAFKLVREVKTNQMEPTSYKDFKSRITQFEVWLLKNGFTNRYISSVNKKTIINYLNYVQSKSSSKNRNNTRIAISTFYETLIDNEISVVNFVSDINVIKTNPKRNKTYSAKQDADILQHLEKNDKVLHLFVQFICYTILRPIEICRLQVKDIDLLERKIYVKTKTTAYKTKLIPQILIDALPDLSQMDGDTYLFTRFGFGYKWISEDSHRREYFTECFKNVVKIPFKLDKNYTMYSFKHTYITKIYNSLLIDSTPFEAKSKLMLITGHSTMKALDMYLRDIDAVLPDDYSKHIKKD